VPPRYRERLPTANIGTKHRRATADFRPPNSVKCRGRISLHMLLTPTDILEAFRELDADYDANALNQ